MLPIMHPYSCPSLCPIPPPPVSASPPCTPTPCWPTSARALPKADGSWPWPLTAYGGCPTVQNGASHSASIISLNVLPECKFQQKKPINPDSVWSELSTFLFLAVPNWLMNSQKFHAGSSHDFFWVTYSNEKIWNRIFWETDMFPTGSLLAAENCHF